jgi:class 3 adenylate cyclase/tetratricopeptide (TPR) repeat protein
MPSCRVCTRDNPAAAQFCMWCGSRLRTTAATGQARRTVTVVFCDVVGSTPMAEEFDTERVRSFMTQFFSEMRSVLERHGGIVEKYIGDAVMAVFGIPTLHEDDALRAVRAAADMRTALAAVNDDLRRTTGMSIATRTGVNTGEVVVGDLGGAESVLGDAVNVAARLQGAATPGGILLGRDTYRLVRDAVEVGEAMSLVLRGKGEAVTAYPLVAVLEPGAGQQRAGAPRLVGREAELRTLNEAYGQAVARRECRIVAVLGDAGIGKSRLAAEFVRGLAGDAIAATGRCLPYGDGITFWPVAEAVWHLAGVDADQPRETAAARVGALLEGAEDGAMLFDRVSTAAGLGGGTPAMHETFWAIRRLIEWVARERPLALTFDDMQWAESAFLDLIDYVARSARDVPVLILCLARNELLEERPEWFTQLPSATTIRIAPLERSDTLTMIDDLVHDGRIDEGLRRRIAEAGDGNPLFVEEIVQMLREDGALDEPAPSRAAIAVPPTIHALMAARLDRLTPDEALAMRAAAVIGKTFSWDAVAELVPEALRLSTGGILQSLVRRQLITPDPSPFVGEDAFRFHHQLIQETAYRETPKAARAELHARFAGWLERTAGEGVGEFEEILGYHQERAAQYLRELARSGPEVERLVDDAHRALAGAGRRALARGDVSAAANLLSRGHEVVSPNDPRRAEIAPDLAEAVMETGDLQHAQGLLAEAATSGDRGLEAHAQVVSLVLREFMEPERRAEEAPQVLEGVIRVFEELGDDLGLARALRLMADIHWTRGRYADVDRLLERAIEHAGKAGAGAEQAASLREYAGSALYGPTPVPDVIERCEWITRASDHRAAEAGALRTRGVAYAMLGRFEEGRELVARSARLLEDLGLRLRAAFVSDAAGAVETLAGDHPAAERALRVGYDTIEEVGERAYLSTVSAMLARAIWAQGRSQEAATFCSLAEETGAEDDITTQVLWRTARARILAGDGRTEEAMGLARAAVTLAERTDDINMQADALVDLGEALGAAGDREASEAALRRAHGLYEAKGNVVSAASTERALGGR